MRHRFSHYLIFLAGLFISSPVLASTCNPFVTSPAANTTVMGIQAFGIWEGCPGGLSHFDVLTLGSAKTQTAVGTSFSSLSVDTTSLTNGTYSAVLTVFDQWGANVLGRSAPVTYVVSNSVSTPSPSPTPMPTASPTASPTPSPMPSCAFSYTSTQIVANCPIVAPGFSTATASPIPSTTPTPVPSATPTPVAMLKANDFLNTLGVDTKYAWQKQDSIAQVQTILTYTGIRHTREDGNTDATTLTALCNLHTALGTTSVMLPWGGDITDTMSFWKTLATCGELLAMEGKNEPNNFGDFTYNGNPCGHLSPTGSYLGCAQFQRDLYAAVKADSVLQVYPMWAETEPGAEPDNTGLQFLTIPAGTGAELPDGTQYADVANVHNYVKCNGCSPMDNVAWWAEDPLNNMWSYDGMDGEFVKSTFNKHFPAAPAGTLLPRVTTETGWDTASVSQDQQGKTLVNVYFSAAARGWLYTFIYQAKDDGDTFGIYDSSMNPKLAATYIHNLTTILADSSTAFTPVVLPITISPLPATVHSLLMQKSNGTYELAVWDDRPVGTGSDTVTVQLPQSYLTVNVYDVTTGTAPVQALSNVSSLSLTLSDHAMIVEFK